MISCGIFNQYYYDLLKKIREIAKKHKDHSSTSKKIIEVAKENYQTFDKSSPEYIDFLKSSCNEDFWKSYLELPKEECDDWLKKDEIKSVEIFKKINIGDIAKVLRDNFLCHHYLTVFYIFKNDLEDEEATKILSILQSFDLEFELDNANFKTVINRLNSIKTEKIKSDAGNDAMDDLKDTTIGKIAKEIIDDIDITKLKKSISDEGDIFKALANPDNGLGELFTNVGNKVTSKISSGELNQEAIMKDAMKFMSLLPSMCGDTEGGSAAGGGLNMADMMKMMSAMNGMGAMGGGKHQKMGVNKQKLKELAKRAELKKKVSKKNDS